MLLQYSRSRGADFVWFGQGLTFPPEAILRADLTYHFLRCANGITILQVEPSQA